MKQTARIQHLLDLLKTKQFSSHEEILEALRKLKIHATQATLSRDLTRLGIHKAQGIYQLQQHDKSIQIRSAGPCLLVLKTAPGHAPAIAAQIDAKRMPELIGSLAGDDTIFLACQDLKSQNHIHKILLEIF